MTDPGTQTLAYVFTGAIGAVLGPIYGPVVLAAFGALMGGLLAMSRAETKGKLAALNFLAIAVGVSMALTGIGVWAVEHWTTIPGNIALVPVSFMFALSRNLLLNFLEKVLDGLSSLVARKGA